MAVVFRSETGGTGTGNFTPSYPSGATTDDFIELHIGFEKGTDVSFGGPGIGDWTPIDRDDNTTNIGYAVYYLKYDGTTLGQINPSGGPKLTWSTVRRDGQDLTSPIDVTYSSNDNTGDPDFIGGLDPTISNGYCVISGGNKSAPTGTAPTGYTEDVDRANTGDGLSCTWVGHKQLTVDTLESPGDIDFTDESEWADVAFIIKPSSGVPRNVNCTTEALSVSENAATINRQRGVNTTAEAINVTENSATVNRARGVACSTETIQLIVSAAVINPPLTELAYFDASYSGPTDPDAVWTNDADAFDGSTATKASCATAGNFSLNELRGGGHTGSAATFDQILTARARFYWDEPVAGALAILLWDTTFDILYRDIVSSGGGDWTPWDKVADPAGGWTADEFDQLELVAYENAGGTVELYRCEIEWTYRPDVTFSVYYFDTSDEGPTDTQAVWNDDTAAFDSNPEGGSELPGGNNGSSTNNALSGGGTTAPASGADIIVVYARSHYSKGGYTNLKGEIYTDGKSELLGTIDQFGSASFGNIWTEWIELTVPSGGWTWAKVQALEIYTYGIGSSGASAYARHNEIKVGATPAADRNVTCTTEILEVAENVATVNRSREVSGSTEALQLGINSATVNRARGAIGSIEALVVSENPATIKTDRGVGGLSESLVVAENIATVNRARLVGGAVEALELTENAATITFDRSIAGITEALELVEIAATINRSRLVAGSAEALTLTENAATITIGRTVSGISEALELAENAAAINRTRTVAGIIEALALTENGATITTSRGVSGFVEILVVTEAAANINRTLNVAGLVEALIVTENAAQVFRGANRIVNGLTEILTLIEGVSAINRTRNVASTTEALSAAQNPATVARVRVVAGSPEGVIVSATSATINRQRAAQGVSEILTLTENPASITTGRLVSGTSEALAVTGTAAVIARNRGVNGITEPIILTENPATITINIPRVVVGTTEALLSATNPASINRVRGAVGVTETLAITGIQATVNASRIASGAVEVVELTENPAAVFFNRIVTGIAEQLILVENASTVTASRYVAGVVEVLIITTTQAVIDRGLVCPYPGIIVIQEAAFDRLDSFNYSPQPDVLWPGLQETPPETGMWLQPKLSPGESGDIAWDNDSCINTTGMFQILVYFRPGHGQIEPSELADALIEFFPKGTELGPVRVRKQPWQTPMVTEDASSLYIPVMVPYMGLT